jgi:hypothetical protein
MESIYRCTCEDINRCVAAESPQEAISIFQKAYRLDDFEREVCGVQHITHRKFLLKNET